jgi:hypothetical protein
MRPFNTCAALDQAELREFQHLGSHVHFPSHETVFVQEEMTTSFYNLLEMRLYKLPPDGRRQIVGFALPGDFLGMATSAHHSFSADAIGAVAVCRFSRNSFTRFVEDKPHLLCRINEFAVCDTGLELKNLVVWAKDNAGMGSFYRSKHELCFVFKSGGASHTNTFELGQHGRYRTNVWEYAGVNTFRNGRLDELAMHPTVKPVAMIADAIRDVTRRAEIVLDPFAGSGTTVIAAEKTGRHARAIEYDPGYCDVIVRRWQSIPARPQPLMVRTELLRTSKVKAPSSTNRSPLKPAQHLPESPELYCHDR